jgi:hypothetical protein
MASGTPEPFNLRRKRMRTGWKYHVLWQACSLIVTRSLNVSLRVLRVTRSFNARSVGVVLGIGGKWE